MTISPQLVRASRIMAALSMAGAVVVPALIVVCFIFPGAMRGMDIRIDHLGADLLATIPLRFRIAAGALALIPAAIVSYALIALARLFRAFASGEVFSETALHALSQVTTAMFLNVLVAFVMQAPISLLLSWSHGAGHREISLGFGSDDVVTLFVAGVALVIARVMAEARRVAAENASFV